MTGSARPPIACLLLLALLLSPVGAQNETTPPGAESLTATNVLSEDQIQARLEYLQGNKELDEAIRAKAVEHLQAALTARKAAASWASLAQEYSARSQRTAAELQELSQAAAEPPDQVAPREADYATTKLSELEALLQSRKAELDKARTERDEVTKELARREARSQTALPEQMASAGQRLADVERQLNSPPAEELNAEILDARAAMLAAQHLAVQNELEALRRELAYYEESREVFLKRRELQESRVRVLQTNVDWWQRLVDRRRRSDVAAQVQEARGRVDQVLTSLRPSAQRNLELAQQREELASELRRAQMESVETDRLVEEIRQQFLRTQTQVNKLSEMTEAVGTLLRKQRQELPSIRRLQRAAQEHQAKLRQALGSQLRLEDHARENHQQLIATTDQIRQLLERLKPQLDTWLPQIAQVLTRDLETGRRNPDELPTPELLQYYINAAGNLLLEIQQPVPDSMDQVLQQLRTLEQEGSLLIRRGQYIDSLAVDYKAYFNILFNLAIVDRQLIDLIQQYREFVDERALWICSTEVLSLEDAQYAWAAVRELADPPTWARLARESWRQLMHYSWIMALALLALGPFYLYGVRLREMITQLGEKASSSTCRTFRLTLEAAVLTLSISIIWPAILGLVGLWLRSIPYSQETAGLARGLSAGLLMAALVYFPLEVLRQMMRDDGLCEDHLDVPTSAVRIMRRNLRWFTLVLVPLLIVLGLVGFDSRPQWDRSLGRLTFLAIMLSVALFLHRLMHPARGAIRNLLAYRRGSLADRLRRFWYVIVVGIPLALALLSIVGYHFTAQQLAVRLLWTVFLTVALWLVVALLRRWLLVNRRHLAMQQARERLAQRSQEAQVEGSATGTAADTTSLNLSAIDQQTRTLLNAFASVAAIVGVWLIWVDVLPALSRFDQWRAWDTIVEVQSPVPAISTESPGGSESSPSTVQRVEMISVADVALSILVFAATLVATKNMPGLIELALLQRLPMDRALRFAITTVTRYLIFVVGTLWAMTNLGITWSKVQWLVAGVGVGLGFGLQEIFANFISGLIILFERKMRTGDIVTVGDVSGIVTDIRMRATTIEDWDKKELVVPNKEFITGKLLNWTLSNCMNRVVIPIRIAYGSDVAKARQIILQTAVEHPEVLTDPSPSIVFDAFQESGLNLTLRAYLPTLERRLDTINDLHTAIHDALRRGKFEIPFPQREVHVTMHETASLAAGNGNGHRHPDEAPGKRDGNWP